MIRPHSRLLKPETSSGMMEWFETPTAVGNFIRDKRNSFSAVRSGYPLSEKMTSTTTETAMMKNSFSFGNLFYPTPRCVKGGEDVDTGEEAIDEGFQAVTAGPPAGISGAPYDNNIMLWNAVLFGPDDTPWDGGWATCCMSLFYLPFAIANALTARLNDGVPLVDELWVVLGFFAYTVALYLHFATSVAHEITTTLGIYCFRITRKEA